MRVVALSDDVLHFLLDLSQELGSKGLFRVEVIVKTVVYGRADSELGFWTKTFYRLGEHMACAVAKYAQPFRIAAEQGHKLAGAFNGCGKLGDFTVELDSQS